MCGDAIWVKCLLLTASAVVDSADCLCSVPFKRHAKPTFLGSTTHLLSYVKFDILQMASKKNRNYNHRPCKARAHPKLRL